MDRFLSFYPLSLPPSVSLSVSLSLSLSLSLSHTGGLVSYPECLTLTQTFPAEGAKRPNLS